MIGYDLNEQLADREDLDQLKNMGIDLKLDFILNHASAPVSYTHLDVYKRQQLYGGWTINIGCI